MNLHDQIQREALEIGLAEETLSRQQNDWLKDIATWVKEEIDQDPKNLGKNYEHFLNEQAKVFAYQGGFEQPTALALVKREFSRQYEQDIHAYAGQQWRTHLFKAAPNVKRGAGWVGKNINHGPEM